MEPSTYDLEERLISFSVNIIRFTKTISKSIVSDCLINQLIRSATSPALNHGEAQSGESRKDFIHKLKIVLKELRETLVNLKIMQRAEIADPAFDAELAGLMDECNQLISIFVSSVRTAQRNTGPEKVYR